jgi:signal transduction histidine kinase
MRRTALRRSLSAKILLLTIAFVLLGEVLLYVPSIARFRANFLEERIAAAHLATLNLSPSLRLDLDMDTLDALLGHAGVIAVAVYGADNPLILGEIAPYHDMVDLRDQSWPTLISGAVGTMLHRGARLIRVVGPSPQETGTIVDIIMPEAALWVAMVNYSFRILQLSIVLSLLVAVMLFSSLQRLIVEPLQRIKEELAAFRDRPEDGTADSPPSERGDEIGVVEHALADMRQSLRQALAEKTRLAALGAAMSRVSHDLKNILTTAVLISDRLEGSADPQVRKVAPRLIETLERAARLCTETLSYARSGPPAPQPRRVRLLELVEKVRRDLDGRAGTVAWRIEVPDDLDLLVDPDQLFRVLLNLAQNAVEAMGEQGGELRVTALPGPALFALEVADTGPGIPEKVKERLFEPFAGSSKPGGNGLGLAICRELVRAHGGEIELVETSERGTVFRLRLPARLALRAAGPGRSAMHLETVARAAVPFALLLLGGCNVQGPGVAGFPGLQFPIQSYYDTHATEKNWTCNQPRLQAITRAQVVDETPERVVMNIRYYWFDEQATTFEDNVPFGMPALQRCNGWAERTFTFVKRTDGSLQVESMTGPQRR